MTTVSVRRRLVGTLEVALPPAEAFRLFTPRGEEDWVDGWAPRFPDPAADDTEPGTVFETRAHGRTTTWIVRDRRPGRGMSYARFTPGALAGTVAVDLGPTADRPGHSTVTVAYDLTAPCEAARAELDEFAAGYAAFLRSWQDAVADKVLD
ncbi:MAG: SRPBCC family protein [Stackebrandtia sp.]